MVAGDSDTYLQPLSPPVAIQIPSELSAHFWFERLKALTEFRSLPALSISIALDETSRTNSPHRIQATLRAFRHKTERWTANDDGYMALRAPNTSFFALPLTTTSPISQKTIQTVQRTCTAIRTIETPIPSWDQNCVEAASYSHP